MEGKWKGGWKLEEGEGGIERLSGNTTIPVPLLQPRALPSVAPPHQ